MTQKEEVDIVLKEYDALRKEIDERLKTTQINGIYSLLVVVGGVLAFGASHPDPTYVAFIPPVFIAILGVLVHGWKTLVEDTAREIAQVENKMYVITARPLLDHETALARDRNRKSPWPWAMRWVAILTLYTFLEWDMFVQMLRSQFPNDLFHRIESDCYPIRSPSVYDLYIQDVRIETARQTFPIRVARRERKFSVLNSRVQYTTFSTQPGVRGPVACYPCQHPCSTPARGAPETHASWLRVLNYPDRLSIE